jgi:hypothetical protein
MKQQILQKYIDSKFFKFLLVAPALLVIGLSLSAVMRSITSNSFWADDFGNMATFSARFGSLSDNSVNAARPILNLFFYFMGSVFGTGSSTPYILVSTLICLLGLLLIFSNLIKLKIINIEMAIFLFSLLLASLSLWPILLWSTNITHGASILLFGLSLSLFRINSIKEKPSSFVWLLESLCLGLVILCNPLYVGISTIFAFTSLFLFFKRITSMSSAYYFLFFGYFLIAVVSPLVYFFTVSQPNQKVNLAYAGTSVSNILPNLSYYSHGLSSFTLLISTSVIILFVAKFRPTVLDLPLAGAGLSVMVPVLIQSNQRVLNYMVFPIICFGVILARSILKVIESKNYFVIVVMIFVLISPIYFFNQTKDIRSWYIKPGLGSETKVILSQVDMLVPDNSKLCISFELDQIYEDFIIGGISGSSGFAVSPVNSPNTLLDRDSNCLSDNSRTQILIFKNDSESYEAKISS